MTNKISQVDIDNAREFTSYATAVAAAARYYGDNFGAEYASQVKEDVRQDVDGGYAVQFYSGKDSGMEDVYVAIVKEEKEESYLITEDGIIPHE